MSDTYKVLLVLRDLGDDGDLHNVYADDADIVNLPTREVTFEEYHILCRYYARSLKFRLLCIFPRSNKQIELDLDKALAIEKKRIDAFKKQKALKRKDAAKKREVTKLEKARKLLEAAGEL
jgi:hypothetical protein